MRQVEEALTLWRPEDGVWARATLLMTLAQLAAQRGDLATAAGHAERALPDLERLTATDDEIDARSVLAIDALRRGDLARASALVEANHAVAQGPWVFGGVVVNLSAIEVKATNGRLSDDQKYFLEQVNARGGIGICVWSVDELELRLADYLK